jgi:hypothetical protein
MNLDRKDPMASATTMYSCPLTLIPGTNVRVATDKINEVRYLVYSVQTDIPTE